MLSQCSDFLLYSAMSVWHDLDMLLHEAAGRRAGGVKVYCITEECKEKETCPLNGNAPTEPIVTDKMLGQMAQVHECS